MDTIEEIAIEYSTKISDIILVLNKIDKLSSDDLDSKKEFIEKYFNYPQVTISAKESINIDRLNNLIRINVKN